MTTEQIVAELGWTRKAIQEVLGITPRIMRPPFGDIGRSHLCVDDARVSHRVHTDDRVRAICKAMNLEVVIWTRISPTATFDTGGEWLYAPSPCARDSWLAFSCRL